MDGLNSQQRVAFVREGCLMTSENLPIAAIAELLDLLDCVSMLDGDGPDMWGGDLN